MREMGFGHEAGTWVSHEHRILDVSLATYALASQLPRSERDEANFSDLDVQVRGRHY